MSGNENYKFEYIKLSAFVFFIWCSYSFIFSFFPIWLSQSVGLNGTETGIVFSVQSLVALFFQPVFGFIQDRLGLKKNLIYLIVSLILVSAPLLLGIYKPLLIENVMLGAFFGGVYFSLIMFAGGGLIESYVERVATASGGEFGKIRMWGSLGWAVSTFIVGKIIADYEYIVFWLASFSGLIALFISLTIARGIRDLNTSTTRKGVVLTDVMLLLKTRDFLYFSVYVLGVSSVYAIYDQQFPIYFTSMFDNEQQGNEMFGYLNSFQVLLEAGGMFLAPFLVNKVGPKNGLMIAGLIMVFRIAGSALTDSTVVLSVLKLVHSAELPILIVSIFKYIGHNFHEKVSSTMYLFGYLFMTQVSSTIFSTFFGYLYDVMGFRQTYMVMAGLIVFFLVTSYFLLNKDRKSPDGYTLYSESLKTH